MWDGTYIIDDLLDIHEMINVKNEDEIRQEEWRELRKDEIR